MFERPRAGERAVLVHVQRAADRRDDEVGEFRELAASAGAVPSRLLTAPLRDGADRAERWPDPRTYASGLRVPAAVGDSLILEAVRESEGTALAVTDAEMAAAQLELARGEGIFPAPEGGATLAAARKLRESGFLKPEDRVVLFNTGTGLKYPDIPGLRV